MGSSRRLVLALVGVLVFLAYAAAAAFVVAALVALVSLDVPLETALAVAVVGTLAVGYLSARAGAERMLTELDAVPVAPRRAPTAYRTLSELADRMGVEAPTLYVARMAAPNAVTLGGPGGAVVFDETLFRVLDADEVRAVLAHELAHVEHRDDLVQSIAYTVGRTLVGFLVVFVLPAALLARGVSRLRAWVAGRPMERRGRLVHERVGRVVLVAFVLVTVLVRARSRQREFAADDRAVEVTGDPVALASALRKIERAAEPRGLFGSLYRPSSEAEVPRWLSTHPAIGERIERLRDRATDGHRVEVQ